MKQMQKRDDRTELSFLQSSFEWACRKSIFIPLIAFASVPTVEAFGFIPFGALKLLMKTDKEAALARYFERAANKANGNTTEVLENNGRASYHRRCFNFKYSRVSLYDRFEQQFQKSIPNSP